MDMPIPLIVLDSLMDAVESVETLRDHGEAAAYGLALVADKQLIAGIRSLLGEGLIEAWEEPHPGGPLRLISVSKSRPDEATLRRCWFKPTEAGRAAWRGSEAELTAYWDAH